MSGSESRVRQKNGSSPNVERRGIPSSNIFFLVLMAFLVSAHIGINWVDVQERAHSIGLIFRQDPTTDHRFDAIREVLPNGTHLSKQSLQQIYNYRQGTGLLLNLHITHHAGTTFCREIGQAPDANGTTPGYCCILDPKDGYPALKNWPWRHNETASNIASLRPRYHMVSWEFELAPLKVRLAETDFDNPDLLSVLIIRDPIDRLLAGDGYVSKAFPKLREEQTLEQWWPYSHSCYTDNYAMRTLTTPGCCNGSSTDRKYLEAAKEQVSRFSIVLDQACLTEGLLALKLLLNISFAKGNIKRPRPRVTIEFDEIEAYLTERNKLDIELYEWARERALVQCSTPRPPRPAPINATTLARLQQYNSASRGCRLAHDRDFTPSSF